jgi:hypothetical protein
MPKLIQQVCQPPLWAYSSADDLQRLLQDKLALKSAALL